MENQLPDFLQELASGAQSSGRFSRDVKVINCANFDNHGEYYVIPFCDPKFGSPIRQLNRVFELPKIVTGTRQDGSQYTRTITYRFFLNPQYYELTDANTARYEKIKSKANYLLENGWKGAIVRDYTLIQGFIIRSTDKDTKVKYEKTTALMIIRSKNFTKALNEAFISQNNKLNGTEWINQLCNNELERKRFVSTKIQYTQGSGGGYNCTVSFGKFDEDMYAYTGGKDFYDLTPYKETLDQLGNPINKFLDIAVDIPLWNDKYIDELEGHINSCIRTMSSGGTDDKDLPEGIVKPDVDKFPDEPTPKVEEPAPTDMTPNQPQVIEDFSNDDDLPF